MSSDQMGWLITLLLIIAVVFGFMEMYNIAWGIVALGIAIIIYTKLKKSD